MRLSEARVYIRKEGYLFWVWKETDKYFASAKKPMCSDPSIVAEGKEYKNAVVALANLIKEPASE